MTDKLLIARLLAAGEKGATASALYKDLTPTFARGSESAGAKQAVGESLEKAVTAGLVALGAESKNPKYRLTSEGRALALRLFPQSEKKTWSQLKKTWLVVHSLGLESRVKPADVAAFSSLTVLRMILVSQELGLDLPIVPSAKAFEAALAWHAMRDGLTDSVYAWAKGRELTVGVVLSALAASIGEVSPSPKKGDVFARYAAKLAGARNAKELHEALLARLVKGATQKERRAAAAAAPDESEETVNAPAFAERVLAAARRSPTGKLDDSLILINHAHARYVAENPADAPSLADFKRRLTAAALEGALTLASADMPQLLDPDDYRASRIERGISVFSLIRI